IMAVVSLAWSATCPLSGRVSKSQANSESRTLSHSSLKATIFGADVISDGEAKRGLGSHLIRPPQLMASFISNGCWWLGQILGTGRFCPQVTGVVLLLSHLISASKITPKFGAGSIPSIPVRGITVYLS